MKFTIIKVYISTYEKVYFHNNTNEVHELFLLDTYGRLVYKESINKTQTIDVRKYKEGIYYLKINNKKRILFKKIVIK